MKSLESVVDSGTLENLPFQMLPNENKNRWVSGQEQGYLFCTLVEVDFVTISKEGNQVLLSLPHASQISTDRYSYEQFLRKSSA